MRRESAALYPGKIIHTRKGPVSRTFSYGSYFWLVDLDELPSLPTLLRPLASFQVRDHLGAADAPGIKANVEKHLRSHGIELAGGRVRMLANARTFGYVFNPLSVFWCYHADGQIAAVLAEVHNTYSERHVYLLRPDARGRAEVGKEFYVSPFLPMTGDYLMRLPEPGESLAISVTLLVDSAPMLVAGVRGERRPVSYRRLLAYALRYPFGSIRVSLLIRWQALWLLARRVPLIPRPAKSK